MHKKYQTYFSLSAKSRRTLEPEEETKRGKLRDGL